MRHHLLPEILVEDRTEMPDRTDAGPEAVDLDERLGIALSRIKLLTSEVAQRDEVIRNYEDQCERQEEMIAELRRLLAEAERWYVPWREIATYNVETLLPEIAAQVKILERAGHTVALRGVRYDEEADATETEGPGAQYLVLSIEPEVRV